MARTYTEEQRQRNLKRMREYYRTHKEEQRERAKRWKAANPEKVAEAKRRARERAKIRLADERANQPDRVKRRRKVNSRLKVNYRDRYNQLKESYGCLNPGCTWQDDYLACMLDFHHLDPATKSKSVSQLVNSPSAMYAEIAKCTCLCSNCHRLITCNKLQSSSLPVCEIPALLP